MNSLTCFFKDLAYFCEYLSWRISLIISFQQTPGQHQLKQFWWPLLVEHILVCWNNFKRLPNFWKFLEKYLWVGLIYITFEQLFALLIENAWTFAKNIFHHIHFIWGSPGYAIFVVNCSYSNSFLTDFSADLEIFF